MSEGDEVRLGIEFVPNRVQGRIAAERHDRLRALEGRAVRRTVIRIPNVDRNRAGEFGTLLDERLRETRDQFIASVLNDHARLRTQGKCQVRDRDADRGIARNEHGALDTAVPHVGPARARYEFVECVRAAEFALDRCRERAARDALEEAIERVIDDGLGVSRARDDGARRANAGRKIGIGPTFGCVADRGDQTKCRYVAHI